MLQIHTIPCRIGSMDNLSYLLVDEASGQSAIVDPSEVAPIIAKLNELNIIPNYIFNTHHHFDHTDGNLELKKRFGSKVLGNINDAQRIPGFDIGVSPNSTFALGESIAEIIDVSAHTQNHILWYFKKDKALFTGDTLFNLCVGGLFEGSVDEMFVALSKIRQLPDDVLFYPGHEYTMPSISYANHFVKDKNAFETYLKQAQERLNQGLPVSPTSLELEKKCNPYLQANTIDEFTKLF